jgi:HSP20 family molecular chaperone IbpA
MNPLRTDREGFFIAVRQTSHDLRCKSAQFSPRKFLRRFALREDANRSWVNADSKEGILKVCIPKAP